MTTDKHNHYFKDVSHLQKIDIYRILDLYGVTDPAIQHAVKKLLCAGERGVKDKEKDYREAVDSINRQVEMMREDNQPNKLFDGTKYIKASFCR